MKFCRKCGSEIRENIKFCPKCGEKICNDSLETVKSNSNSYISNSVKNIKGINKKNIIIVAVIILSMILIYKGGQYFTGKNRLVQKFEKALIGKDSEELSKYLVSSDSAININNENLKGLITFLDENPSERNEIIKSIKDQSIKLDSNIKLKDNSGYSNSNQLFTLKKNGKIAGIFDKYIFIIEPIYIEVHGNLKGTKFYLQDELLGTADSDSFTKEFGPYVPANYEIKAEFNGEYADFQKSGIIDLTNNYDGNKLSLDFYFDYGYVDVTCNYENADVYINDKNTGLKVKEAKEIGPISDHEAVMIYCEKKFDNEIVKSNQVKVYGDTYADLEIVREEAQDVSTDVSSDVLSAKDSFLNLRKAFNKVEASSVLKSMGKNNYVPENLLDDKIETAWVEGVDGDGEGEYIKISADSPQKINRIEICNGYGKSEESYNANNRVKTVKIEFSDGKTIEKQLGDLRRVSNYIEFDEAITTEYVKITILDVYKGSKYPDTCISEILLY